MSDGHRYLHIFLIRHIVRQRKPYIDREYRDRIRNTSLIYHGLYSAFLLVFYCFVCCDTQTASFSFFELCTKH